MYPTIKELNNNMRCFEIDQHHLQMHYVHFVKQ